MYFVRVGGGGTCVVQVDKHATILSISELILVNTPARPLSPDDLKPLSRLGMHTYWQGSVQKGGGFLPLAF